MTKEKAATQKSIRGIPDELWERIHKVARMKGRLFGPFVLRVLEKGLKEEEKSDEK